MFVYKNNWLILFDLLICGVDMTRFPTRKKITVVCTLYHQFFDWIRPILLLCVCFIIPILYAHFVFISYVCSFVILIFVHILNPVYSLYSKYIVPWKLMYYTHDETKTKNLNAEFSCFFPLLTSISWCMWIQEAYVVEVFSLSFANQTNQTQTAQKRMRKKRTINS